MGRDDQSAGAGFSRRRFLQGAGGAAAGPAIVGISNYATAQEQAPPSKPGFQQYNAEGAEIALNVNGESQSVSVSPQTTLLQALRESLDLTGAKEVCDRGSCGACTVLVDGRSVNSCSMLAIDAIGSEVTTVEGLVKDGELDPVQQAFVDHDACQCGYCIPGFVVRSRALLDETPALDREQVKHGLCGNICRCAAYVRILDAVTAAADGGQR